MSRLNLWWPRSAVAVIAISFVLALWTRVYSGLLRTSYGVRGDYGRGIMARFRRYAGKSSYIDPGNPRTSERLIN
jgi:hypothetical protein